MQGSPEFRRAYSEEKPKKTQLALPDSDHSDKDDATTHVNDCCIPVIVANYDDSKPKQKCDKPTYETASDELAGLIQPITANPYSKQARQIAEDFQKKTVILDLK